MLALALIILGIGSRLVTHAPQFTAVLAVSLFAGLYLPRWQALTLPVAMMVITDFILGPHDTMVFTWGSMLAISAIGIWLKDRKSVWTVLGGSICSAVLFFIVTNLAAWPTLYPTTWAGLRECFIMAVPFFRTTLVSTVAYSLVLYAGYEWVLQKAYLSGKLR